MTICGKYFSLSDLLWWGFIWPKWPGQILSSGKSKLFIIIRIRIHEQSFLVNDGRKLFFINILLVFFLTYIIFPSPLHMVINVKRISNNKSFFYNNLTANTGCLIQRPGYAARPKQVKKLSLSQQFLNLLLSLKCAPRSDWRKTRKSNLKRMNIAIKIFLVNN